MKVFEISLFHIILTHDHKFCNLTNIKTITHIGLKYTIQKAESISCPDGYSIVTK